MGGAHRKSGCWILTLAILAVLSSPVAGAVWLVSS